MNLIDSFNDAIAVPPIKHIEEVGKVLDKLGFMNKSEREEILSQLSLL